MLMISHIVTAIFDRNRGTQSIKEYYDKDDWIKYFESNYNKMGWYSVIVAVGTIFGGVMILFLTTISDSVVTTFTVSIFPQHIDPMTLVQYIKGTIHLGIIIIILGIWIFFKLLPLCIGLISLMLIFFSVFIMTKAGRRIFVLLFVLHLRFHAELKSVTSETIDKFTKQHADTIDKITYLEVINV
jgi:hypothetical protein